jgi:hypothetical protein
VDWDWYDGLGNKFLVRGYCDDDGFVFIHRGTKVKFERKDRDRKVLGTSLYGQHGKFRPRNFDRAESRRFCVDEEKGIVLGKDIEMVEEKIRLVPGGKADSGFL